MNLKLGQHITGFLFSTSLAAILIFFVLFHFTSFENLEPTVQDLAQEQIEKESLNDAEFTNMKIGLTQMCDQSTTGFIDVQTENNRTIGLDCNDVYGAENSSQLYGSIAADSFKEIYYKDYGCDFVGCILSERNTTEKLSVFVSETANVFYGKAQFYALISTIAFGVLYAYFLRKPSKITKSFGWSFTFIGAGFIVTEIMKRTSIGQNSSIVSAVAEGTFANIQVYLMILFVVGIALLVTSYFLSKYENEK